MKKEIENEMETIVQTWIMGGKPIKVTIHRNSLISDEAMDNFARELIRIEKSIGR